MSTGHPANTVVVGIDDRGQHGFDLSLEAAVAWAARRGLDVTLLSSVVNDDPTVTDYGSVQARRTSRLLRAAAVTAGSLSDPPVVVHTVLSQLPADEALLAEADRAALIVVQRRRLGRWTRLHAGSVTWKVAGESSCPVLIVHDVGENADWDPQHGVLVAIDLRGHAEHAVGVAFEEASWRGVPLTALHAWPPVLPDGYVPSDYYELDAAVPEAERALAEALAGYTGRYPDVPVRRAVVRGEVKSALDDASREHDLLVIARQTDEHHHQWNLGSVVRHVIERARCPVLVTPAARPVGSEALQRRESRVGGSGC